VALTNSQYNSILRGYEAAQNRNHQLLMARREEVYRTIPAYEELEQEISSYSVACGKRLLDGDSQALAQLKDRLRSLRSQKALLLSQHNFPKHYLEPIYDCPDCQDTGFQEGRMCHCFRQQIITLLYKQSNIQELLQTENFSTLSYSYYEGEALTHFQNAVRNCQAFIRDFDSSYRNLFFYGTAGTGKSFLSCCVAKELLDKGRSVLYFSSTALFETLSQGLSHQNRDELSDTYEDLYHCDLMIIDDLGTELTNHFVSTQLFALLNERHIRKKSTVISTNLSLEELRNRYSDRIFSRITSHYEVCKLTGPDIRMQKKLSMNRK